ncbi:response regulator [Roseomonas sp. GC11]|uniref:response regulator n=1 Tax=Roseomonas sp. GC11 TaxID=2950546 RepID=UPI002109BD77|nr:response regulator [Roseomonas sp. GC11]MCQ4162588.1 response regulator [Roseomonas sp. GC11]
MKTALLVDDSPTMLMTMAGILERMGFAVTTAATGEEGLSCMQKGSFAIVITDYHMPGINGVEMISAARKLPAARFTPMLLLTTESEQRKRDEARAAGATGWLVKPVAPDKLQQVIRQVLPGA